MKKWIVSKIHRFLGIDKILEQNEELKRIATVRQSAIANNCRDVRNLKNDIRNLKKLTQVGIDFHPHGPSWAVVCIAGKSEYIKFMQFDKERMKYFKEFLKSLGRENVILDNPIGLFGHHVEKDLFS